MYYVDFICIFADIITCFCVDEYRDVHYAYVYAYIYAYTYAYIYMHNAYIYAYIHASTYA
jgi:hypothetical protein